MSCVILPGNGVGTLRSGLFLYYGVEARMQPQSATDILSYAHAHMVGLLLRQIGQGS